MQVTIIGWYGTETIGDRAILAGIIHIISRISKSFSIRLGSLNPFFTERCIMEDLDFHKEISNLSLKSISIFDSLHPTELQKNIKASDILMVGGGPLMDLREMSMLEYAFYYAKKHKIRSALVGCGWGPLNDKHIREKAVRLVDMADVVIFRDEVSQQQCLTHYTQPTSKIKNAIDPALLACHHFVLNKKEQRERDYIAVNFRDVSQEGSHYSNKAFSTQIFCDIIHEIAKQTSLPIKLVPMHNFGIGGDDRTFLNRIEKEACLPSVESIQKPMNLKETMNIFYHAKLCVGMRFHSIVLQTILNGNNYILDYTNPQTGKIAGLIKQLHLNDFYAMRYCSLHHEDDTLHIDVSNDNCYEYNRSMIEEQTNLYTQQLFADVAD